MATSTPAISLEQAQEALTSWLAADKATALGQSYEIDTGGTRRKLSRVDAKEIRENIKFWSSQVHRLSEGSGGPKMKLVVPRD